MADHGELTGVRRVVRTPVAGGAIYQIKLKDGSIVKGEFQRPVIKVKTTLGTMECRVADISTIKQASSA